MAGTGCEHETSDIVAEAALWLARTPKEQRPRSAVVELKLRFPVDAKQACEAIAEAARIRSVA
jgi:hypothetical protein